MKNKLLEALKTIPVAELTRDGWLKAGMALKHEGYDVSVWDDWSQNDTRYHEGECQRIWDSFHGTDTPVTGGTIVMIAKQYGWQEYDATEEIGWDGVISYDGSDVEPETESASTTALSVDVIADMSPAEQIKTYLQTLFKPDEYVAYVTTDTWQAEDRKYVPGAGYYGRTAGELIASLDKHPDDIGYTFGDAKPEAGAWIMINPCDGKGVKQEHITAYRYALLECDEIPKAEQIRLFRESKLPIDMMTDSGGKSIHALVKVDAKRDKEYSERINYLYDYCDRHGIPVDKQNKNPNRKSRLPGFTRNGNRQRIVSLHTGLQSWEEWVRYVESGVDDSEPLIEADSPKDGFPDTEPLSTYVSAPALPEELIKGILRVGHKMLISCASKAGKSVLMMELSIAIAEGLSWLGFPCKQGKVLYVNLEIDKRSCVNRFFEIYDAINVPKANKDNIVLWNLRGHAVPLNQLVPSLIDRVKGKGFEAVIVDPIYKVITGDENSATAMAEFTNNFDKICTETGCSVIYIHHHSKGAQGGKKAMDRASGSGVFARDPDALLDVVELELTDEIKSKLSDGNVTAWRMESSLREFANIKPTDFWFEYPVHRVDDKGELSDLSPAGAPQSSQAKKDSKTADQADDEFRRAYEVLNMGGDVKITDIAEYLGLKEKTVYDRRKRLESEFTLVDGVVTRVS